MTKPHYTQQRKRANVKRVIYLITEIYKNKGQPFLPETERNNLITMLCVEHGFSRRNANETIDLAIDYIQLNPLEVKKIEKNTTLEKSN